FPDSGASLPGWLPGGIGENIASTSGLTAGFYHGNWHVLFTALQSNTESNILATPSIVTLDNMEAEFTVGQDVPVLTGSQTTTGDNVYQSVSRRSIGIKLKVKPQISQGSAVVMEIEQEVSSLSEAANKDNLGPTFNTRTVRNAVQVVSGNTVVVGGLLDNNGSRNIDSVPFLGKLPLVGALFRYQSDKTSKRNLMLFIRPTIIRSQNDYADSTALQRNKFGDALVPSAAAKFIERDYNQILGANPSYPVLEETRRLITDFYQANAK
ncbi:type II secretion system protein GspD, partial [Pantoea endophytica]